MTDDAPRRISVCIQAFDEEAAIAATVHATAGVLAAMPGEHEILVCDDGSRDATPAVLRGLCDELPLLRVLTQPENRGIALARRRLVEEARGEVIFHMPADGECRPEALVALLARLDNGFDIVLGVRRRKRYTLPRLVQSWTYRALVALCFGDDLRDPGGVRLARATIWKRLHAESTSAFYMAEKLLVGLRHGARLGFVPVDHAWRATGTSRFSGPRPALAALRDLIAFRLSARSRARSGSRNRG